MGAGWDAELDGLSGAGAGHLLDLGEFGAGSGEADLEAFDFAEPSFAAGFFDPGQQVLADIEEALALGWVGAQQRAAQAGVLVDAGGGVGATAGAEGDLAMLEVAEKLLPFCVGRGPVFLGRAQRPAAGNECAVAVDGFLGIDGLVTHRGVDVAVAGDELGDVRWHSVQDGVGDEDPPEIVRSESQRLSSRVAQ